MTYRQTLEYLYAQLPMYHRIGPAAYKNDLSNTLALCAHLGNPERKFPCVHVAGTNGKGSVSHLLAAVCQAAGLKTGLYISPHYKDFRERIKINGQYIPRKNVVSFIEKNRPAIENIQPSFFEMTVGMAFDYFAQEKVDIAIIEVGLGGRLDSTNVVTPLLSVITNISFDHVALLGDTLAKIAGEKAGIIKPHVPVVVGEFQEETMPVFRQKASECEAALFCASEQFEIQEVESQAGTTIFQVFKKNEQGARGTVCFEKLLVDAAGPFQAKNLGTVLQALEVLAAQFPALERRQILEKSIRAGLQDLHKSVRFMGRWQIIGEKPTILCDSAHNEGGLRLVFERVRSLPFQKLHIVTGFVNDKDLDGVLRLFPSAATYYFAKANIPRGLDATVLCEKAKKCGLLGKNYTSVKNALRAAKRAAAPEDLILVVGSIFIVAEIV